MKLYHIDKWTKNKLFSPGILVTSLVVGSVAATALTGCNTNARRRAEAPVPITIARDAESPSYQEVDKEPSPSPTVKPKAEDTRPFGRDRSLLATFYVQKYTDDEIDAVREPLAEILPDYSDSELDRVAEEILDYHHIIYHQTPRHNLVRNHEVAESILPDLESACSLFDVPLEPVLAIISWENSGDTDKLSWANAAGVGQMTQGAVSRAHTFGKQEAIRLKREVKMLRRSEDPDDLSLADELEQRAEAMDCAKRHSEVAKERGVKNESLVPELNVEDTVLFFKYLMRCYDNRVDLAISAYHNGVGNNDDIIAQYIKYKDGKAFKPNQDGTALAKAIARLDIKYIDLWNYKVTREMLAGLRTVEGKPVKEGSSHLALGDESDIYPWKVIGCWTGLKAGPHYVETEMDYNKDRWDLSEVKGLIEYDSVEKLLELQKLKNWAKLPLAVKKVNLTGPEAVKGSKASKAKVSAAAKEASLLATPELIGYLFDLDARFKAAAGDKGALLPLGCLSGAWALGSKQTACLDSSSGSHLRGVACDLYLNKLPEKQRAILNGLLRHDFLFSRIYMTRNKKGVHVVLNPRYGNDFLQLFRSYVPEKKAKPKQESKQEAKQETKSDSKESKPDKKLNKGADKKSAKVPEKEAAKEHNKALEAKKPLSTPQALALEASPSASPESSTQSRVVYYGEVAPRELCLRVRSCILGAVQTDNDTNELESEPSESSVSGKGSKARKGSHEDKTEEEQLAVASQRYTPVNVNIVGNRRKAKAEQKALEEKQAEDREKRATDNKDKNNKDKNNKDKNNKDNHRSDLDQSREEHSNSLPEDSSDLKGPALPGDDGFDGTERKKEGVVSF